MTHLGTAPSAAAGHRHALARAVVTGVGIVAPNGRNAEEYWSAVLRGESGIARITRFDPSRYSVQLAAQADIDAPARLSSRLLPQTDTMTRLALVAAEEALRDAGVDSRQTSGYAAGVVTAASAGGSSFVQHELEALQSKGNAYVSAYHSFAWFYPVNSGQISIRYNLRGPGGALVADQAGGLDAISRSRRLLRDGTALMLTGGVDGSLCPWALSRMSSPREAGAPSACTGRSPGARPPSTLLQVPRAFPGYAASSSWPSPTPG